MSLRESRYTEYGSQCRSYQWSLLPSPSCSWCQSPRGPPPSWSSITAMPVVMVPSIVPLLVIVMVFFPLSTFPISMPVIASVDIPARTDDNSGRIDSPRDANVDSAKGFLEQQQ